MPTSTDEKLAEEIHEVSESLTDFRIDVTEKFGAVNARLEGFRGEMTEKVGEVNGKSGEVNARLEGMAVQLKFIRWVGVYFATILVPVFIGVVTVAWNASALNTDVKSRNRLIDEVESKVKVQGEGLQRIEGRMDGLGKRMEKVEGRMDGIEKKLDVLISRGEPKAGV